MTLADGLLHKLFTNCSLESVLKLRNGCGMRNRHSITLDPHELKVMKTLSAELRCGDAAGTRLLERIVGQKPPDASDRILKPRPAHNRTAVGQFVESGSLILSPRKPGISSIPIELTSHKGSGGTAT